MGNTRKHLCIHGHFYQPPRENPWLEAIEPQDSAYPYHDWNERINAECFAPNSASRILDSHHRIFRIVNNYSRMSFNFGPTLLSWMEREAKDVYRAILDADRESKELFGGHGSAIAQAYNHAILPLAPKRLKKLQIRWGIRDFEYRFGRKPEGLWLPETAVDLETLEILAAEGIRFTILAPSQARRVRRLGTSEWQEIGSDSIDSRRAYQANLPTGRGIALFFYNGPISRAVAFEGLLSSGEAFTSRLLQSFSSSPEDPELVHIASDGETYGHHHRFGEMALAWALDRVAQDPEVQLTNYGQFLSLHPPSWEVEIRENTSWSCAHGIERWKEDCGCNTGYNPGWNQRWRKPLREAVEQLTGDLGALYERRAVDLLKDPWKALENYIDVILDRSDQNTRRFLARHSRKKPTKKSVVEVLKLLEMQRFSALSHTSCGWFFDDISGIEPRQVLQYAGRAIQLAQDLSGSNYESRFAAILEQAESNVPAEKNGAEIYRKWVRENSVDLLKVAANYALCSLFDAYRARSRVYCFELAHEDYRSFQSGMARIAVGKSMVRSAITGESEKVSFGAMSMGNHTLLGGVRFFKSESEYVQLKADLESAVERVDFPEIIRRLDRHFGQAVYSLNSLFLAEQQQVLNILLDSTLSEVESSLSSIYHRHNPLMRYLEHQKVPVPPVLHMTTQFVINNQLKRCLLQEQVDLRLISQLLEEAERHGIELDRPGLRYNFEKALERLAQKAFRTETNGNTLGILAKAISLMESSRLEANLWKVQNLYYETLTRIQQDRMRPKPPPSWMAHFLSLSEKLSISVPALGCSEALLGRDCLRITARKVGQGP